MTVASSHGRRRVEELGALLGTELEELKASISESEQQLMRKCDLCHDRTAVGQKPMCATVCPSGALFYGSREEVEDLRRARPLNQFLFGEQEVRTRNHVMVPAPTDRLGVGGGAAPTRSRAEQHLEEALC